jgi:hypothetical protein
MSSITYEHAINKQDPLMEFSLDEAQFNEILEALREKKNVILQGGPGVGKTFVAKRLAYALVGSHDLQRVEMIQFPQSYKNYFQCYRSPQYGIFHQFCRRAQQEEAQGTPYVFIIDEVNRDNLSKLLGELTMLIEPDKRWKRHTIALADLEDADERFYIPENLYLIGIMNTAHFSLAMVDEALWQRFRFITLYPHFASRAFMNLLMGCGVSEELIKKIVSNMGCLNHDIAVDKNLGDGYMIGRSYFYPRNGIKPDDDWYRWVIEAEIMPLIQEYWFDNEQMVELQRSSFLA